MWTLQLLGGLVANSELRQLTRFRTQKAASLLAYLAQHTAPQPRETLIEMLWPDTQPEVGRHNLSNALSFLRHMLEPRASHPEPSSWPTASPSGSIIRPSPPMSPPLRPLRTKPDRRGDCSRSVLLCWNWRPNAIRGACCRASIRP